MLTSLASGTQLAAVLPGRDLDVVLRLGVVDGAIHIDDLAVRGNLAFGAPHSDTVLCQIDVVCAVRFDLTRIAGLALVLADLLFLCRLRTGGASNIDIWRVSFCFFSDGFFIFFPPMFFRFFV